MINSILRVRRSRWIAICALAAASIATTSFGFAAQSVALHVSNIIVFGDSYEDEGTGLRITSAAVEARIPGSKVLPSDPTKPIYWSGRWSNGPTMVEVLARLLGVPLMNYAIGGAKSGSGNYDAWLDYFVDTGVAGQIDSFARSHMAESRDPNTLYIVSASTNDFGQFHDFHQPGRIPIGETPEFTYEALGKRAANNISIDVERLVALGAQQILVFSAYPIVQMPLMALGDPQAAQAEQFTSGFDQELQRQLRRIISPKVHISIFPIGERMQSVILHPEEFGLKDVSHACQVTVPEPILACGSPATFVWWDEIHPTAAMHEILGRMLSEGIIVVDRIDGRH